MKRLKICSIKKSGSYYKVKFDDGNEYKLVEDVIIFYSLLKKNKEVLNIDEILELNDYYLCLNKAYQYLANVHSKKEVYDYLIKKYSKDIVLRVINKLEEQKLLDEDRYAELLLEHYLRVQKGKDLYLYNLKEEGLSNEAILKAKDLYSFELELDTALKLFSKVKNNYDKHSIKEKENKIRAYFLSRGFSLNIINILLEKNHDLIDNIDNESKALSYQYEKAKRELKKKYSNKELEEKIMARLLRRGFRYEAVKDIVKGEKIK